MSCLQVEDAEYSADALRHRPIGEDARGCRYFYFSFNNEDCRLYRETPPAAKAAEDVEAKASWDTVCTTIEEMTEFAEQFSASRHRGEKSMHNMLLNSIVPGLIETVAARKRAEDKAAALEAMPRKRSSRIQVGFSRVATESKRHQSCFSGGTCLPPRKPL